MPGGVKALTTTTTSTSRNSQARIAVEEEINSVESARKSVPDDNWDIDAYDEVALEGEELVLGNLDSRTVMDANGVRKFSSSMNEHLAPWRSPPAVRTYPPKHLRHEAGCALIHTPTRTQPPASAQRSELREQDPRYPRV